MGIGSEETTVVDSRRGEQKQEKDPLSVIRHDLRKPEEILGRVTRSQNIAGS